MSTFSFTSTAHDVTEGIALDGKTIAITGINSGLGHESARVLAARGARIVGAARTEDKARDAISALGIDGLAVACDLSEPTSVRAATATIAASEAKLDVILCNAGIMALPERTVKHGLELQFLTNHIGHFMFATGLLDKLADDGRVVVVASAAYTMAPKEGVILDDLAAERDYQPWANYGQSKLANILFARALDRRFDGTKKMAVSLHPGVIRTNLGRNNPKMVDGIFAEMNPASIKTIPQGAATQCLLAARPEGADAGGQYWSDCQPTETKGPANDSALAEQLWSKSEALVAALA